MNEATTGHHENVSGTRRKERKNMAGGEARFPKTVTEGWIRMLGEGGEDGE